MRISDWSSDVCSSDLWAEVMRARVGDVYMRWDPNDKVPLFSAIPACPRQDTESPDDFLSGRVQRRVLRSEEHTSELQSLMRISYAVFCLKKKNHPTTPYSNQHTTPPPTTPDPYV